MQKLKLLILYPKKNIKVFFSMKWYFTTPIYLICAILLYSILIDAYSYSSLMVSDVYFKTYHNERTIFYRLKNYSYLPITLSNYKCSTKLDSLSIKDETKWIIKSGQKKTIEITKESGDTLLNNYKLHFYYTYYSTLNPFRKKYHRKFSYQAQAFCDIKIKISHKERVEKNEEAVFIFNPNDGID